MDCIKVEKANAMDNIRHKTIKKLILLLEMSVSVVAIPWVVTWIPVAVRISHLCAFLLCNAVILLIVFLNNSDQLHPDLYEDFGRHIILSSSSENATVGPEVRDKQEYAIARTQSDEYGKVKKVEELSNEEFRLKIEAFIAAHQLYGTPTSSLN